MVKTLAICDFSPKCEKGSLPNLSDLWHEPFHDCDVIGSGVYRKDTDELIIVPGICDRDMDFAVLNSDNVEWFSLVKNARCMLGFNVYQAALDQVSSDSSDLLETEVEYFVKFLFDGVKAYSVMTYGGKLTDSRDALCEFAYMCMDIVSSCSLACVVTDHVLTGEGGDVPNLRVTYPSHATVSFFEFHRKYARKNSRTGIKDAEPRFLVPLISDALFFMRCCATGTLFMPRGDRLCLCSMGARRVGVETPFFEVFMDSQQEILLPMVKGVTLLCGEKDDFSVVPHVSYET